MDASKSMYPRQKEIAWSPQIAYAVGLITTDGCLSPDGRHFDFTSNDKDQMETFKKCLNLKNGIVRKRSSYTNRLSSFHIQFGNVTLYRWLLDVGLMPNKSKRLGALKIPNDLFFDFLRGHLDGDGCIMKYNDPVYPKSLRLYTTFMSASLPHILWLRRKITSATGKRGFIRNDPVTFRLTFSKQDSIALLNRIYYKPNVPRLERKFFIAKEFVTSPR
ncbi:hypothetical protein M1295_03075 [Patescibacteria group bacterium]|nr:hypothetical protein [Patescibacteria group bacterium]